MKTLRIFTYVLVLSLLLSACGVAKAPDSTSGYVLTTGLKDGKLAFIGIGGEIENVANPVLKADPGETVTITLINGEGAEHDIFFPELDARTERISGQGNSISISFTVPNRDVALEYYDSVPGHAEAGMKGYIQIGNADVPMAASAPVVEQSVPTSGKTVEYSLTTGLADGKMVFIGAGGVIDGKTDPDLSAGLGDMLRITLSSGEGAEHDISFEGFSVTSPRVSGQGNSINFEFIVDKEGTFAYFCTVPGHRMAGMEGKLIVGSGVASASENSTQPSGATDSMASMEVVGAVDASAVDIVRLPDDIPAPLGSRGPEKVVVNLESVEVSGILADGSSYTFWTFNGKVPGPFLRVRVGDTVEVRFKNNLSSTMTHSVDFHAVTGPGGGAVATQTGPGNETMFTFKALNPGLYVYHCATPMVAHHISNGMYGLILVEPEGGLPPVDREFYVMQGEIYTVQPFGTAGHLADDTTKLLDEDPEYFLFNGAVGALTSMHPLTANTGETVRIFMGVGGPNFTSSFHVIGEIFDRVYDQASLTANPLTDVQTTIVPPGGATMVEFKLEVPGRYILVDHALSRLQRGLAGYLIVEGNENKDVFNAVVTPGGGH